MNYTAPEILLIIAAIGAIITQSITAWRQTNKLETIGQKTAVIEGHVNSKETRYIEELKSKDIQIELLNSLIASKDRDKALLAQAVATRQRIEPALPVPAPFVHLAPTDTQLQKEIAVNTAETVKAVKELKEDG